MIDPRYWIKHWLVRRALASYSLYDVPHKQSESRLSRSEAMENFEYFMNVRLDRLKFFQEWLSRRFGVLASLDEEGVRSLDKWMSGYGGGLISDEPGMYNIFDCYEPAWLGCRAGYNVAIDIAIFVGEYAICKQSSLYWEFFEGSIVDGRFFPGSNMFRPHLNGFKVNGWSSDLFGFGFGVILASRSESLLKEIRYYKEKDFISKKCKDILYQSKLDYDKNDLIIYGDSSNEQL